MEQRFEMFTMLIAKLSRNIKKIKSCEMAKYNLKTPHVSCLYYMYKYNAPVTAKLLAEICDEDKGAISRSIDYLESNGFIECDSNVSKRYNSPLRLTEKAKVVAKEIADKIDNIVGIASNGMKDNEREIFYKNLILVSDNLQKYCDDLE